MKRRKKAKPSRLTDRRKELGLSGAELARRVGITPAHLHDIESGRIAAPGVHVGLRLAEALDVDIRELFRGAA